MGRRTVRITCAGIVAALAISACGEGAHFVNNPRPSNRLDVTVYVDGNHVSISPDKFGGGPVRLIVTNGAADSKTLNIEHDGSVVATSHTIDGLQTADIYTNLSSGTYFASAGRQVATAKISVGKPRPNADNALLQP